MKTFHYPPFSKWNEKLYGLLHVNDALKVVEWMLARHGDTYTVKSRLLEQKFIFTQNPELIDHFMRKNHRNYEKSFLQAELLRKYIGKGLLTNSGNSWRTQRRLIQPAFSHKRIETLASIMLDEISKSLDNIPLNETVDLYPIFNKLAFHVIARSLFSSQIAANDIDFIEKTLTQSQKYYIQELRNPAYRLVLNGFGYIRKNLRQIGHARSILQQIINDRRVSQQQPDDILQLMLEMRYEDTGEPMDDEQLIDELLILFSAGHETSANSLAFTLYLLGLHPEAQQKVIDENENLDSQKFAIETVFGKTYTQNLIKESLRLYPPAWLTDRVAIEDDSLLGYSWEKGSILVGVNYCMNRNPKIWAEPDKFMPDRFDDESIKEKVFIPFGSGPRFCIGEHFAIIEMVLSLRYFFSKYRFESKPHKLKPQPYITLRPSKVLGKLVAL